MHLKKKISVVIPTTDNYQNVYNRYSYLLVNSYIGEIIFVNDGAKWDIINKYNNVIFINDPGIGYCLSAARNKGALMSNFDYLWFLDDDCFPLMDNLNQVLKECISCNINFGLRININRFNIIKSNNNNTQYGLDKNIKIKQENLKGTIVENNMIISKKIFYQLSGFMTEYKLYGIIGQEFLNRLSKAHLNAKLKGNLIVYQITDLKREGSIKSYQKNLQIAISRTLYPLVTSQEFTNKILKGGISINYNKKGKIFFDILKSIAIGLKNKIK